MRVGVCFSGHMRTFDKTVDSVKKHLLDRYDTKVFIHTWGNVGTSRPEDNGGTANFVDKDAIIRAYDPAMLQIEPQKQFDIGNSFVFWTARTPPHNVISKWYSAQSAFHLYQSWTKENEELDVIVSVRPDMMFHSDVLLNDEKNVVFVPGNCRVPEGTLHDYFGFGDPQIMKRYFDTFNSFHKICDNLSSFKPEAVFTGHVLFNQIPVKYCSIDYSLVRLNGEIRRC